jgi:penicillin amidase
VQGMTIPGAPFVVSGHNARIAWGVTSAGADAQDLVLERIDIARKRYLTPGGWQPVEVEAVEIPVRGAQAEPFEVWRTRHGAVFADESLEWEAPPAWLSPSADRGGEQRALVLQWAGIDGGSADGLEAIARAGGWAEFQAGIDRVAALSLNWIYADVDGHIGYVLSGTVPQRASGDGRVPQAGWLGDRGWRGLMQGAALPRGLDPATGFLASSNNPVLPGGTPFIAHDWFAPWRASRVVARLREGAPLDLPAAVALQGDLRSEAAHQVLGGIPGAVATAAKAGSDGDAVRVLERLQAWDGVMDGRPEVSLYQAFEDALWRRTFTDELEPALFERFYEWAGAERVAGLYAGLADPRGRWWDDIGTVDRRESRDDIYVLAAADARRLLGETYGAETAWSWTQVHAATFAHPLGDGGRPLAWLFSRGPVPVVGDGTTVMRISHRRLRGFGAFELPSWRQVLDVGAWDTSRVAMPTGQSGHPLSPNYFDQNAAWAAGEYRPLHFSRLAVEGARAHRLVLTP